jgi:hypothetical protein
MPQVLRPEQVINPTLTIGACVKKSEKGLIA